MPSTKALARTAGLLYLVVAIFGGFSEYVRTSAFVAGDAAATAANVAAHATLFHVAFVTDLVDLPFFVAVGILMWVILRGVNPGVALAMVVINAISVAIQGLNMLNHIAALMVATQPGLGSPGLVQFLLEMHQQGYLIAQIFFGLYMLPLGFLVYRSGIFPKALGIGLVIGCAGYLGGIAADWASPTFTSGAATYFGLVGGLGELLFLAWLIAFGARAESPHQGVVAEGAVA